MFATKVSSSYSRADLEREKQIDQMPSTEHRRTDLEKDMPLQVDDVEAFTKDSKTELSKAGADYSGATAKANPEEIALVRKLDYRIMPALFCMYFL
jgi:hypothetical protein